MANIQGQKKWSEVRLLETHELARGGVNGNLNEQAKALADRTELLMQEKASKSEITNGFREYATYAAFWADLQNVPVNSTVVIGEENTTGTGTWGIGNNRWDGTTLSKSPFDPVETSKKLIREKVFEITYRPQLIPLYADKNKNVPVYLENGGLSFSFLGNQGVKAVVDGLSNQGVFVSSVQASNYFQPIVVDKNKNVPLYLIGGNLGFSGLSKKSKEIVKGIINPYSSNLPIATDGRTLWPWKAKKSKLLSDLTGNLRIMTIGDSYMQLTPIPQAIANVFRKKYGKGEGGWITAGEQTYIDGVTSTFVGSWSLYDKQKSANQSQNGYAIDGQSRSTTADGARWLLKDVETDKLTIFYLDNDGVFDFGFYLDGVVQFERITCGNTGEVKSFTVTNQNAGKTMFELKRISGTIFIYGFYAGNNANNGVTVNSCGNSGSVSTNLINMTTEKGYEDTFNFINPDLIVFTLGTNDAAVSFGVTSFFNEVDALIANFRRLKPDIGIILIAPPRTQQESGNRIHLSLFRNALYELALKNKCEFINLYDEWGSYDQMNSIGMFSDSVHPSLAGGTYISELIVNKLGA